MTTRAPDPETRCEWCGAEYDPANRPPEAPHATARPAAAAGGEPATHCEWCGAEYPLPEASPGS
jgi:hypothetical protein